MGDSHFMQGRVALYDFFRDPCTIGMPSRSGTFQNDPVESRIESQFPAAIGMDAFVNLFQLFFQASGDDKLAGRQDHPGIGAPPQNRLAF